MKSNEFLNEDGGISSSGGFATTVMPLGNTIRRVPKKKKRVEEMDSQQPTGRLKADGTRSHSNYGNRDSDEPWQPTPVKLDIPLRRHMLKKLAWETDWDLSDLEHLTDKELADLYHEKVADARDFYNNLKANADKVFAKKGLKGTMESLEESKSWEDYGMPTAEEEPKKKPERRLHSWLQYALEKDKEKEDKEKAVEEEKQRLDPKCWDGYKKQGTKIKGGVRVNNCVPESKLNEFAPPSDDSGDDGFSDETLKRLAAQWYNGDEDPKIERTLAAAGWEIGQDEGYDDEPGVFVVQAGDVNGNSYLSWPADELRSMSEAGSAAQQAAIAINMKKNHKKPKKLDEAPIELDPAEPTNPMIYGHNKANPAKLQYRMMRAAGQFRDLAERVNRAQEAGSLQMWQSIVANFEELAMNVDQIGHALKELEQTRRKGGKNSRGIPDLS